MQRSVRVRTVDRQHHEEFEPPPVQRRKLEVTWRRTVPHSDPSLPHSAKERKVWSKPKLRIKFQWKVEGFVVAEEFNPLESAAQLIVCALLVRQRVLRSEVGKTPVFRGIFESVREVSGPTTPGEVITGESRLLKFKDGGICIDQVSQQAVHDPSWAPSTTLVTRALPLGQQVKEAIKKWRNSFGTSPFQSEVNEALLVDLEVVHFQ